MKQDDSTGAKPLYTLIPLEQFKSVLSVDDRDDTMSGYCLVTASFTIEEYCKRRFLRKKYREHITFSGDVVSDLSPLPLREYPVTKIHAVNVITDYRDPRTSLNLIGMMLFRPAERMQIFPAALSFPPP